MQTRRKIASRAKPGGARFTASRTNRQTFIAGLGSFVLTGQAAIFMRAALQFIADQGSFALSGQSAGFLRALRVIAAQGAFALAGQDAGFMRALRVDAANAAFNLTGQSAGFLRASRIDAGQGSFTLSGQDAGFLRARRIITNQGSFALSGQIAGFIRALRLDAANAAFGLTGQSASLTRVGLWGADAGSFALTGQDAGFIRALRTDAGQGAFALTGQGAGFLRGMLWGADAGAFALSGQAASFGLASTGVVAADLGSFALSGQDAGFVRALRLAADQGSFALDGQPANLAEARSLVAGAGSFALNGQAATISVTAPLAIGSTNTSAETVNVNTATVNMPASIVAGNLLLMFFNSNGATLPTTPSGWSQLATIPNADTLTVLAKIADGTEGATLAMTLQASATARSAHAVYRITGNRNGVTTAEIQVATVSGGAGDANPNPPNLAPGWGSVGALWFAAAGIANGSRTVSSYPSGYTSNQLTINGSTAGAATRVAVAANLATLSSDDPGTYTLDATDLWTAATVAVRPV